MSKKYVYTLTQTSNNADGTTTALFEATLADGQGRHFERITGADLPSIYKRLGIEPDSSGASIVSAPEKTSHDARINFDMASYAARAA